MLVVAEMGFVILGMINVFLFSVLFGGFDKYLCSSLVKLEFVFGEGDGF